MKVVKLLDYSQNDTQLASYAVKEGIVKETKEWAKLRRS